MKSRLHQYVQDLSINISRVALGACGWGSSSALPTAQGQVENALCCTAHGGIQQDHTNDQQICTLIHVSAPILLQWKTHSAHQMCTIQPLAFQGLIHLFPTAHLPLSAHPHFLLSLYWFLLIHKWTTCLSLCHFFYLKKKIQWRRIKQCVQHQNEEVLIFANLYYYLFCPYHPQPITFLSSSPEAGKHWIRHVSFKSMVSYFYYIHVNNIWYGVVCFWTNRQKCFPTICVIYYWYVWTCLYYSNALWYLFLLMRSLLLV